MATIQSTTTRGNGGGERHEETGPPSDAVLQRWLGMTGGRWGNQRCASASARLHMLELLADSTHGQAVRWHCDRWACPGCRRRKIVGYGIWFARCLLAAPGPLFSLDYGPGGWDKLRKSLSRNKATWVRVGDTGGSGTVYGAYPPGKGQRGTRVGAGAQWFIDLLGRSLRHLGIPDDGEVARLVECSRGGGWRMPDPPSKWRHAGRLPTGERKDVAAAADRLGLEYEAPDGRDLLSFRLTPEVGIDDLGTAAAVEYHRRLLLGSDEGGVDGGSDSA